MTTATTAFGLDRPEILSPIPDLAGQTILVTGSGGYIGSRIIQTLQTLGAHPLDCEPPDRCVLDPAELPDADWCLHLAAHKYATTAEEQPAQVAELNIQGTQNIIDRYGPNVVLASTCKAADPMTVYGASKLIAERIALNAGARVVRFVNVLASTGSVLQLWDQLLTSDPIPVTPCERMWMTDTEAAHLMIAATAWPTGRYALNVPEPERVADLACRIHPGREQALIPPRRGDRIRERLVAESEMTIEHGDVIQILHPADA